MNRLSIFIVANIVLCSIILCVACGKIPVFQAESEQSPVKLFSASPKASIAIVTHSTLDVDYIDVAKGNHIGYSTKHGYDYYFRNNNIDGGKFRDPQADTKLFQLGLYWQKITAVQDALNEDYQWVVWIDADAIFTNFDTTIESVIAKYPNKDLIIAPDHFAGLHDKINAGIFIVRNTEWSRNFFTVISDLYPRYRNNRTPEQQAMQDAIYGYVNRNINGQLLVANIGHRSYRDSEIGNQVGITLQREINAFYVATDSAPEFARWQGGDFIAHFAAVKGRKAKMNALLDCMAKNGGSQQCAWQP